MDSKIDSAGSYKNRPKRKYMLTAKRKGIKVNN